MSNNTSDDASKFLGRDSDGRLLADKPDMQETSCKVIGPNA